jgi:hypothetical protein
MHQSEQPHSHNEKIDEINLPAIPREDITAEKIFLPTAHQKWKRYYIT